MTQYELSRQYWDWAFENPELIKPTHTAIYFFAMEHCNRLGWREKFGLPTSMTMEAIGVKSYNAYIKHFNELVEWGLIKIIEYSKNQYSSNIIALSKNDKAKDKANNKALDKALIKKENSSIKKEQSIVESTEQSTGESNYSIDKPITIEQETINESAFFVFSNWILKNANRVSKMGEPFTEPQFQKLIEDYTAEQVKELLLKMHNHKDLTKKNVSAYLTFKNWATRNGWIPIKKKSDTYTPPIPYL